ncbi:MAG TPA: ATP-binding protein [Tenuifilaceae bacterium]|nr:ATP-binding protein [Tenuifilaceae bacterium]
MEKIEKPQRTWIKPKVILAFMVIVAIAVAAVAITFKGFLGLTKTRETLSQPNKKLVKLNGILTEIYDAEGSIRTYTLTHEEDYLNQYFTSLLNVNDEVDSLLVLTLNDPIQRSKVELIKNLLLRKGRILNDLLYLKSSDHTSQFYEMAVQELERLEPDSAVGPSVVVSTTTTKTTTKDSVITQSLADVQSDEGFFNRMKGWFSKKEITKDTTITKLMVEVETRIDTMQKAFVPSDSLLNEVIKILSSIQQEHTFALNLISSKELELLKSDKAIMDQIRTILSMLEKEELSASYIKAQEAKELVRESTISLLVLGGVAFLIIVIFTAIIFREVSQSVYYRNRLFEAKQLAEKLLRAKEEFLANMSHEIRTPLSAVIGFSRQLGKTELSRKQEEFVQSLKTSSEHLLEIINDILDLSKIDAGYLRIESIPFTPFDVLQEVVNTFRIKAKEKNLGLELNAEEEACITVTGDPFRFKQILFNLISNAIKFTEKGHVAVNAKCLEINETTARYAFEVSDTGIGIPEEKLESIFEQFTQADSSTTRQYGGTGLGLTIVKKLAELQGATISVASSTKTGSTFSLAISYNISKDLPIKSDREIASINLTLPSEIKALVVDDDPMSQMLISEMLKAFGAEAESIGDPAKALELIKENQFSVILTDIHMPNISGFDLVKAIREHFQDTEQPHVIALTANNINDNPEFYKEFGFDGVLIKPFYEIQLYNQIAPFVNQETMEFTPPEVAENEENKTPFDLTDIHKFSGGDSESARLILKTFMDNASSNLSNLVEFAERNDWQKVKETSHRMKSGFKQFKIYSIAETLESIENADFSSIDESVLVQTIQVVAEEIAKIQELLILEMERL